MSKQNIIIGAHMLETITRGMYDDSRTIFREYIQNSCDAVDAAVNAGVLSENEGRIDIDLDYDSRKITITDNGIGISAKDFRRVMGNIADSDKRHSENRCFRGIGRLCGLAYCGTVRFTAKFRGERVISRLVCEAGTLHELLNERDSGINRYTAAEVLEMINEFSSENTDDIDAHYFIVELEDINAENDNLLDYMDIKTYLSMTAPLPYDNGFAPYGKMIHEYAERLGRRIDEYNIFLNGEQLFKGYTREFETSLCIDEVFGLEFHDFTDDNDNLIAWMWFGISLFRGVIKNDILMRGIRLRKKNIQIGNEYTLQKLFAEDRGINYFIGEVFCVSEDLVLSNHREYFIENPVRTELESQLREYFTELRTIYYDSSRVYNLFKKVDGTESGMKALTAINRVRMKGGVIQRIIEYIELEQPHGNMIQDTHPRRHSLKKEAMLTKIFDIINANTDPDTAERIIAQIRNTLK